MTIETTIPYRFLLRGGTAAALATSAGTPKAREIVYSTDGFNFKVGDGATTFNSLRWLLPPFAAAAGTDTLTATFTAKPVLFDGLTVYVRAAAANTGAVTFNPNTLGALAVTKFGGTALTAGDISGAGHELILRYRSSATRWELLNPATAAAPAPAATYTRQALTAASSPSNQSATNGMVILFCDCTAGAILVNLPTAVGNTALYVIKKTDAAANAVTVDPNAAETINGSATAVISIQHESRSFVSDGSNWHVV